MAEKKKPVITGKDADTVEFVVKKGQHYGVNKEYKEDAIVPIRRSEAKAIEAAFGDKLRRVEG